MKSQLYTRTGDQGLTSLVGGERVKKNSVRLESYGTLDELSSAIGMVIADKACTSEVKGQLLEVQNELFNLGAYLATAAPQGQETTCASLADGSKTEALESRIDALDEQTPKIRAFVLPGGCETAARCHVARTICRRAERAALTLADTEYVDPAVIRYLNRLSDYLFIAARYENFRQGEEEIIWRQ